MEVQKKQGDILVVGNHEEMHVFHQCDGGKYWYCHQSTIQCRKCNHPIKRSLAERLLKEALNESR